MTMNITTVDPFEVINLSNDLKALSGLLYGLSANAQSGICVGSEELDLLASLTAEASKRLNDIFPVNA